MFKRIAKAIAPDVRTYIRTSKIDEIRAIYRGYIDEYLRDSMGTLTPDAYKELSDKLLQELLYEAD